MDVVATAEVHESDADEEIHLPDAPMALVDITCVNEKGNSALILAAGEDRLLLVQHILQLAGETGRLEQVLMMRNADGMSALDMAIRRGAGRSAALIAEAASKERKRRRSRLRRLSTSAVALRRQDRYKSEEPPTVRVRDIEEALRKRREEEERIEQIMSEEVEKAGQKVKQADMARQRTISTNSSAASIEEQPGGQVESRNFAQKAVSSLTEKLSNVLRSKKNRVETLPPVDPRRKDLRSKAQGSLDNTEPFTPDVMEEGEIETLGPDGLYPSEERAMAQSYRFPKILHRRRAASEHRSAANKK